MNYSISDNSKSFTVICEKTFGRQIIYTDQTFINENNIVAEFTKSFPIHNQNRTEIQYLDNYYRGVQPILFRQKKIRPSINNRIVENHAFEIVEHKVAENFGEPVQYILRGNTEGKSEQINKLNDYMECVDKSEVDIDMGRWRSICGTSYRFVWTDKTKLIDDSVPFGISSEPPDHTYVVYFSDAGHRPAYSVQEYKTEDGKNAYFIYTNKQTFVIQGGKVIQSGINGQGYIPVTEYPNNSRRLSDIEMVISMLDAMNKMQSDRMNGVEQFVQAFIKFINCEIDETTFIKMVELGAITAKTQNVGMPASIDSVANQLDQQQTQVAKDDLYNNILIIEGMPDRQENSGGDTGQAVVLRNGFYFSEKRAELNEPTFKKAEKAFLRNILNICKAKDKLDLKISDIDIHITRSKMDNMQVKAQVLKMLLDAGIDHDRAIKTVNLWSDAEQVCIESRKRLDLLYPTEKEVGDGNETN